MAQGETMPCPNCQRRHGHTEYKRQPHLQEPGKGCPVLPDDVPCECGAVLRYTVPIFHSGYGWEWRIVKPAGNPQRT